MVPTRRGPSELAARRAACGVSKEGGSRGAARDIAVELLAWASQPQSDGTAEQRKDDDTVEVR
jgi:hypothetical protein